MATYKHPRKKDPTTVGDAIKDLLATYRLQGKYSQVEVLSTWEELMGKPIASRTSKLFFKNDVLFVELNSAALKHELNLSKSKVLSKLQDQFGKTVVGEVVFM